MQPFPTTHWSLVNRAGVGPNEARREALAALIGRYSPALKAHLTAHLRLDADRADDLLQGFIASEILEQDLLHHLDPGKGKFRSLLLTALDRFAISDLRYATRRKRHAANTVPIDNASEPADGKIMPPDEGFDLAWAKQVINEALAHMEAECRDSNRLDVWGVFDARLVAPLVREEPPPRYEAMVRQLKITSATQAANLLVTGKRMFGRALRMVVREYAMTEGDIDDEIRDLREILARGARS